MARKPHPQAMRDRATRTAAAMTAPGAVAAQPPKKRTTPAQFIQEVRAETRKITWTSRSETWVTSVMVALMVVLAAVFFFVVNWACNLGVTTLIKLATGG